MNHKSAMKGQDATKTHSDHAQYMYGKLDQDFIPNVTMAVLKQFVVTHLEEQVIQSSCSQLTILAAIPPAPAVPRRIYLTLATRITALTIWVVNIRSPLILLFTRLLVTSGNSLCGILINVLIFLCCRISKE